MSAPGKYKAFFKNYDGSDEFSVTFGWIEEEMAFREAVQRLTEFINKRSSEEKKGEKGKRGKKQESKILRQKPLDGIAFKTTLQAQVVEDHLNEFKRIVGLGVFNKEGDNRFYVIPLPALPADE